MMFKKSVACADVLVMGHAGGISRTSIASMHRDAILVGTNRPTYLDKDTEMVNLAVTDNEFIIRNYAHSLPRCVSIDSNDKPRAKQFDGVKSNQRPHGWYRQFDTKNKK